MAKVKRIFDITFSLGAILFFLPLGLGIILCTWFSSPGPVLYSCRRVGKGGRSIYCWKFRTMCVDAERRLGEILLDPVAKEEWDTYYKLKNDPRIHAVG